VKENIHHGAFARAIVQLENEVGSMSDLRPDLANSVANAFYKFCLLSEPMDEAERRKYLIPYIGIAPSPVYETERIMGVYADVTSLFSRLGPMISSLRGVGATSPPLRKYLEVHLLDVLKYKIKNSESKTPIRRAVERFFCAPALEIAGMHVAVEYYRSSPAFRRLQADNYVATSSVNGAKQESSTPATRQPTHPPAENSDKSFLPTVPKFDASHFVAVVTHGDFELRLFRDLVPVIEAALGTKTGFSYPFAAIVKSRSRDEVVCLLSVEDGPTLTRYLCVWAPDASSHRNLCPCDDCKSLEDFVNVATKWLAPTQGRD